MTEEQTTPTGEENRADTPQQDGVVFDEGQAPEQPPEQNDEGKKEATPEINQDNVNKKINRLTFQYREEERQKKALLKQNEDLKAKLNAPYSDKPPPMPDPYDEHYQEKMVKWQEDVQRFAEVQGEQKYRQKIQREQALKELDQKVKGMYEKADKYGIQPFELKEAELKVSRVLESQPETKTDIANFLLSHEESPLIIKHLANSAEDLYRLNDMDTAQAAVYLNTVVSQKAQALKPKVSTAPKPMDIPEGKGAGEKVSEYLKGVVFE